MGGYGALVDADLDGIDVRLGWPVATIDHRADRIAVTSVDGRTIAADQVVVTVPLALLAAEVIAVDPPLPDAHREAIAGLATGLLDKVWLRWDEPWWTEEAEVWSSVDGPFEWCNLLPATGEAVLLAFIGATAAREWTSTPRRRPPGRRPGRPGPLPRRRLVADASPRHSYLRPISRSMGRRF